MKSLEVSLLSWTSPVGVGLGTPPTVLGLALTEKGCMEALKAVWCSRDGQDLTSARRPGIRRSYCRIRPTASQIPGFPPFRPGVDAR